MKVPSPSRKIMMVVLLTLLYLLTVVNRKEDLHQWENPCFRTNAKQVQGMWSKNI